MNPLTPALHQRLHRLLAPAFLALTLLTAFGTVFAADAPAAKTDLIVGRWRWVNNDVVTILPDGTASCPSVGNATWKCTSKAKPPTYVLNWKDGIFIDTVHLLKGGKEINGKNAQGQPIIATRLPDLPTK
jgi:hypothetical protein